MGLTAAAPDNELLNDGGTLTGGADLAAVLADASDATYVTFPGTGGLGSVDFAAPSPAVPAGAKVKSKALLVRSYAKVGGYVNQDVTLYHGATLPYETAFSRLLLHNATVAQVTVCPVGYDATVPFATVGAPPGFSFSDDLRVTSLSLAIEYVAKPTLTVDYPTGTLSEDNMPEVAWTPTLDASGGPQRLVGIKIIDEATYTGGGFNPETASSVDSGAVTTAATRWRGSVALSDGNYRAYVKTGQYWYDANGDFQSIASDWEYSAFTVDVDLPAVPNISIVPIDDGYPVPATWITIATQAGDATTDYCQLEYSDDDGTTWQPLRTKGEGGRTLPGLSAVYDYEAPSGAERRYRVRAIHLYSSEAFSDWVYGAATLDAERWAIVHPTSPELSATVDLRSFASHERAARQSVKQPLGRSDAVVLSDRRGPESGTVVVRLPDDLTRDRVMAIATDTDAVLLNPPSGHHERQRWVALGDEQVERLVDNAWITERNGSYVWTEIARPEGSIVEWTEYHQAVMASEPELYWRLNETSGTAIADSSGNGHTGKIYDNQVVATTGVLLGFWRSITRDRGSNYSAQINGDWTGDPASQTHPGAGIRADDYKPYVPGSQRSFECWLYKYNDESFQTIFSGSGSGAVPSSSDKHPTWEMGSPTDSGMMRFYPSVGTYPVGFVDWGTANTGHPDTDFELSSAMHIVCTFDDAARVAEWWVCGRSQGAQGPTGYYGVPLAYPTSGDPGYFQVGWRGNYTSPNPEVYAGRISDIAVYERILDPDEIAEHYRAGKPD